MKCRRLAGGRIRITVQCIIISLILLAENKSGRLIKNNIIITSDQNSETVVTISICCRSCHLVTGSIIERNRYTGSSGFTRILNTITVCIIPDTAANRGRNKITEILIKIVFIRAQIDTGCGIVTAIRINGVGSGSLKNSRKSGCINSYLITIPFIQVLKEIITLGISGGLDSHTIAITEVNSSRWCQGNCNACELFPGIVNTVIIHIMPDKITNGPRINCCRNGVGHNPVGNFSGL